MGNRGTDLGSSDLPDLDSDASASEDERVLGRRHLGGRTKCRYMTKTVHHEPMLALHVHNNLQCSIDVSRTVLDQANLQWSDKVVLSVAGFSAVHGTDLLLPSTSFSRTIVISARTGRTIVTVTGLHALFVPSKTP